MTHYRLIGRRSDDEYPVGTGAFPRSVAVGGHHVTAITIVPSNMNAIPINFNAPTFSFKSVLLK